MPDRPCTIITNRGQDIANRLIACAGLVCDRADLAQQTQNINQCRTIRRATELRIVFGGNRTDETGKHLETPRLKQFGPHTETKQVMQASLPANHRNVRAPLPGHKGILAYYCTREKNISRVQYNQSFRPGHRCFATPSGAQNTLLAISGPKP